MQKLKKKGNRKRHKKMSYVSDPCKISVSLVRMDQGCQHCNIDLFLHLFIINFEIVVALEFNYFSR